MDFNETKNDIDIVDWLDTINARENTIINYSRAMSNFTEFTGRTPGQLLDEARAEVRAGKLLSERSLRKQLVGYRKHLQDRKLAPTTIKLYLAGVVSFYRTNDLEVPKLPRNTKARPLQAHNEIPTKEQLMDVIKVADLLEKAVVLAGCSSGLATEELTRLTVGQFKNGYDLETGITTIKMRRTKSDTDFITFFSPEASRAIQDYLNDRDRADEKHNTRQEQRRDKQRVLSDSGYLFVMKSIPEEYLEAKDESIRSYNCDKFSKLYRRLSARAGKSTGKGVWNVIRAHNMRKYYNSTMLNAGADSFFVEYTMGHTLDETRAAYFRPDPEKLKETYMRYVSALTVLPALDLDNSEEYQQAIAEKDALASLHIKRDLQYDMELRKQRERIEELEKKYDQALTEKISAEVEKLLLKRGK